MFHTEITHFENKVKKLKKIMYNLSLEHNIANSHNHFNYLKHYHKFKLQLYVLKDEKIFLPLN